MVRIYANLIIKKIKTIDQVPKKYKEPTLEMLLIMKYLMTLTFSQ